MDLLLSAWRATLLWIRATTLKIKRRLMGAPPKTVAEQVAAATPVELGGQVSALQIARSITFRVKDNPPPSAYYLSPDEALLIQVTSNANGTAIGMGGRFLLADGRVQVINQVLALPSGSASGSFFVALGECFLLDLTFNNQTAAVQPGMIYVNVQVVRGASKASAFLTGNLVEGYISNGYQLFWPNGKVIPMFTGPAAIISQNVANPGAGNQFTFTVPTGQRIRTHTVKFVLTTSGVAGTRYVALNLTDGVNVIGTVPSISTQAASMANVYTFALGLGAELAAPAPGFVADPLPDLFLAAGWQIASNVQGLLAGDILSSIQLAFEMWQGA